MVNSWTLALSKEVTSIVRYNGACYQCMCVCKQVFVCVVCVRNIECTNFRLAIKLNDIGNTGMGNAVPFPSQLSARKKETSMYDSPALILFIAGQLVTCDPQEDTILQREQVHITWPSQITMAYNTLDTSAQKRCIRQTKKQHGSVSVRNLEMPTYCSENMYKWNIICPQ